MGIYAACRILRGRRSKMLAFLLVCCIFIFTYFYLLSLNREHKMNKRNIEKLASVIENQPDVKTSDEEGFCMRTIYHDCGTPACIKGWNSFLFDYSPMQCTLGIPLYDAKELTTPDNDYAYYSETDPDNPEFISAKRAAKVLRNLAKTGEVDWSI